MRPASPGAPRSVLTLSSLVGALCEQLGPPATSYALRKIRTLDHEQRLESKKRNRETASASNKGVVIDAFMHWTPYRALRQALWFLQLSEMSPRPTQRCR